MRAILCIGAGLVVATGVGCESLTSLQAQMPTATYQDAKLVQAPSQQMMLQYYCPKVVHDPFGLTPIACTTAFGDAPADSDMKVAFDLAFDVHNPNHFPIPVAEMLTAVTVFPNNNAQALGASCVVFCSARDPSCTGAPRPDSCTAKSTDLRSLGDFANATANLVIANGVALVEGQQLTFKMPEVAQDGDAVIHARLAFGVEPLSNALEQLLSQTVKQVSQLQSVTFEIPYRIEGTVWLDAGSLGRVAVGFGPVHGVWTLPTDRLTPRL